MYEILLSISVIAGATVILSAAVLATGHLRAERQRTLQKLLDRGVAMDELMRAAGLVAPPDADRRRGLLLIAVGAAWSSATFLVGGRAWIMGVVPVIIGLGFLLLWMLDGRRR
jgi:hypothetical protein